MATEKYTTLGQTSLTSSYTSGGTTLVIGNASSLPPSGNFRLRIENEIFKCTAVSGLNLTVAGAQENTIASNHPSGATVTEVVTAAMLDAIRADICQTGLTASTPSTEKDGILYLPSDGFDITRDNGSTLAHWLAPAVGFQPYSGLTWVNQGGATGDSNQNRLSMESPAEASFNIRILKKSMTLISGACTYTVWCIPNVYQYNYPRVGICMRESATGKISFLVRYSGDKNRINVSRTSDTAYTGYTLVYDSGTTLFDSWFTMGVWFRITYTGTNLIYYVSADGKLFKQLYTEAKTVPFTTAPNEIGLFVSSGNENVHAAGISVLSWLES